MTKFSRSTLMVAALFCSLAFPLHSFAGKSAESFVSFRVPGSKATFPLSINDSWTVAGYYVRKDGSQRAFIRHEDGVIEKFAVPGSEVTEAVSINDSGEVAGYYEAAPQSPQSFLRLPDGKIVTFSPPPNGSGMPDISLPSQINVGGTVIGIYPTYIGPAVGYVRAADGTYAEVSLTQGSLYSTVVTAINRSNTTVGYEGSSGINFSTGFIVYGNTIFSDFNEENAFAYFNIGTGTFPTGINSGMTVVGWYSEGKVSPPYQPADQPYLTYSQIVPNVPAAGGFLRYLDGDVATFSPPGTLIYPHLGINDNGTVFGNYSLDTSTTVTHGFVRSEKGKITSFDVPRSSSTTATAINNDDVIAGFSYGHAGKIASGFLRIPARFGDMSQR